MTHPSPANPSDVEAIEARAAAWLVLRDDHLTPDEAREFARWRQADPRHEAAILRLEATWSALRSLQNYRPEAAQHPDRDLLARPLQAPLRCITFPWPVATAAAVCVVLAAAWWLQPPTAKPEAPVTTVYTTTPDGFQRVVLADNSVMTLNSRSEAQVQFSAQLRQVRLVRGEASFGVAKNPTRPFVVTAGPIAVRAVGTAFDVRLTERAVEVLVTEGTVKLAPPQPEAARMPLPPSTEHALATLTAGQRAVVAVDTGVVTTLVQVTPEVMRDTLAWQSPPLIFADTPLAEVVQEFNRRNRTQLVLGDAELGTRPVGGSFHAENVEAFVRLVTSGGEIVAERPAADRIVLRKAK